MLIRVNPIAAVSFSIVLDDMMRIRCGDVSHDKQRKGSDKQRKGSTNKKRRNRQQVMIPPKYYKEQQQHNCSAEQPYEQTQV